MSDSKHIGEVMPQVLEKYQLKALPTIYGGINYRSRIEARWAVFFDTLKLKFDYEPEGFDLDGMWYVPDFWLPELKYWIEIKGDEPNDDACEKASRLAVASGHPAFVFFGGFTNPDAGHLPPSAHAFFADGGGDCEYYWCQCKQCGQLGIEFEARTDRLPCKECYLCAYYRQHPDFDNADIHPSECDRQDGCQRSEHGDKGREVFSRKLFQAYKAARAMRFTR